MTANLFDSDLVKVERTVVDRVTILPPDPVNQLRWLETESVEGATYRVNWSEWVVAMAKEGDALWFRGKAVAGLPMAEWQQVTYVSSMLYDGVVVRLRKVSDGTVFTAYPGLGDHLRRRKPGITPL